MTTWSLRINGTTKTLADWRVNGVNLEKKSPFAASLTFNAPRARIDEAQLCAYGDIVELLRIEDGVSVRWFYGTCDTIPEDAEAANESQGYVILGPGRWLEQNNYQQAWYNGSLYTTHYILSGSLGQNIKAVLDYAIANGAPLQYVAAELIALAAVPPVMESTESYCAGVILDNLEFVPDIMGWFDFATTPPTLHLQRDGSLAAASVRFGDYTGDTSLPRVSNFKPLALDKLRVPSVKINGETLVDIDGVQTMIPSKDVYPPGSTGREDGAFNSVIQLQGQSIVNVFGNLDCETIDTTSLEWFKAHLPALRDTRTNIIRLVPGSVERVDENGVALAVTYPRELPPGGGTITDWMVDSGGNPIVWQREFIRFKIDMEFNETAGDGVPLIGLKDQINVIEIITTNAPAGHSEYSAIDSIEAGDPSIVGLAQFLYQSFNHWTDGAAKTQYQATIALQESQCTGYLDLGLVVNAFGRRIAFQTMRALIQSVTFDIDSGLTQVTCGPPRQWSIASLLALLQRFKTRRRWTNALTQETGESVSNQGQVDLPQASGNTNSAPGIGVTKFFIIKDGTPSITLSATGSQFLIDFGNGKKVTIDATSAAWSNFQNKELKPVQVEVCVNGVTKNMGVLGTDVW